MGSPSADRVCGTNPMPCAPACSPHPHNTECIKLLREYVQIRLDITRRVPSPTEFDAAIARSNAIQEALWQQAKAVAANDTAIVPTGLFIQTLNEMIDNQEKRLNAAFNRVPNIVLIALYGGRCRR